MCNSWQVCCWSSQEGRHLQHRICRHWIFHRYEGWCFEHGCFHLIVLQPKCCQFQDQLLDASLWAKRLAKNNPWLLIVYDNPLIVLGVGHGYICKYQIWTMFVECLYAKHWPCFLLRQNPTVWYFLTMTRSSLEGSLRRRRCVLVIYVCDSNVISFSYQIHSLIEKSLLKSWDAHQTRWE